MKTEQLYGPVKLPGPSRNEPQARLCHTDWASKSSFSCYNSSTWCRSSIFSKNLALDPKTKIVLHCWSPTAKAFNRCSLGGELVGLYCREKKLFACKCYSVGLLKFIDFEMSIVSYSLLDGSILVVNLGRIASFIAQSQLQYLWCTYVKKSVFVFLFFCFFFVIWRLREYFGSFWLIERIMLGWNSSDVSYRKAG